MVFLQLNGERSMKKGPLNPDDNPLFSKPQTIPIEYWDRLKQIYSVDKINFTFLSKPAFVDLKSRKIHFSFSVKETFQLYLVVLTYVYEKKQKGISEKIEWVLPNELKGGIHFFRDSHPIDTEKIIIKYRDNYNLLEERFKKIGALPVSIGDKGFIVPVFDEIFLRYILWEGDEELPSVLTINVQRGLEDFFNLDVIWAMINVVNQILLDY
jgi:hypothetical protein